MEILGLPPWTLSALLQGRAVEFSLGDGRRLAWRASCEERILEQARHPLPAAELLGAALAERLGSSPPRILNLQYEECLDAIAWEALGLETGTLAEHFAVARQLVSGRDPAPALGPMFAEALAVADLQDAAAPALASAQVILLGTAPLASLEQRGSLPAHEHLLVLLQAPPLHQLSVALDRGAAVLVLEEKDLQRETLGALLQQLGSGASVGEAVRWLHRRAAPRRVEARLYGDAAMRFVRAQAPTSRRQVTSLSFDLVGSTVLLQQLGDEAYAEMLVSVYALCTDALRRHGGQPDDYQGDDGVMCYFGHPVAIEDAPVRAVEAGLEIVRTVSDLGVSVRVGVATGPVAVKSNQPVGLSIHLAARLQKVTAPGTVLVSEATRRLVGHAFDLRALDAPLALKGIDAREDYYLVTGPSRDARVHRLERLPWLTPLVGRQDELERLDACWRQARAGECRLAVVRADPGLGKSRLVRELRHRLVDADVKVLECRCRADASASPFLVLAEALRRWLDISAEDEPAEALQKLAAALPHAAREGEPLALMAGLLGLAPQPQQAAAGSPRQRLLATLLDWLDGFADGSPCCLIVEDWHWVDPSLREFVEDLAARRGGPGLLLVLTTRGETAAAPLPSTRHELIDLVGLPPESARELVRQACPGAALPASLVRKLAARGDGVPLFLEEAARMALELGAERLGPAVAALEAVPASLQDLLMARLDGLGAAKPVAQVAAVIGREFSLALLTALFESGNFALDTASVGQRLALLVDSGLVRAAGSGQYAFKHALIRDVAYASLWGRDRHALHARVVKLLQDRWPELAAARPELLALHQTEAGLHAEALAQWELAASNAAARSAEVEAISHLRWALAVLARLEPGVERDRIALRLQLLLAARLIATEGYGAEAVLQAYLEAQRLCDRIGDETARFKVEMGLEAYRFMRAEFGPALEHGRRAAAIAARSDDIKQRLQAHWGLACTLFHQGELLATMREMEAGLALYSPALHRLFGVQDPGIMCMAYSSWGLWELGRPDAALARINHAAAVAREFDHKFSEAVALAYGVSIELLRGDSDAAMVRAQACIRVCEDAGFPVWLAITRCMRGRLLCEQGAFQAGLDEMRAGYAMWLSTGALVSQPLYLGLQTEGLMLAGDWKAAQDCVAQGLAITGRYGERQLEAELLRLHGELALQRGERAEAEAALRAAYALAIRQHRLGFALRSATSLARLWIADGRAARARRLLPHLVERWSEGKATRDVRSALALCESLQ